MPAARFAPTLVPLEDRVTPAVTIRLDYRYDADGFFTPDRRAVLEQVAADIGRRLGDTLAGIAPSGADTWRARLVNPTTLQDTVLENLNIPEGELLVFLGARPAGQAYFAQDLTLLPAAEATGTAEWRTRVLTRGQAGGPADDYAPWGGSITFNSTPGVVDPAYYYRTFAHELFHLLGFKPVPAFSARVAGGRLTGPAVRAVAGDSVPLHADGAHWPPGTTSGGRSALMIPGEAPEGPAVRPTPLDWATLKDIGWQVDPEVLDPNPPPAGTTGGRAVVYAPDAAGRLGASAAATLTPFPGFTGSIRSARADVDGDGTPDAVLVTGPGTPLRVAVVSGADNSTVLVPPTPPFAGSEGFAGGGFAAAADLDGDGRAEWAVTPDQGGGPRVTVFSLVNGSPAARANFFGITGDDNFRGGCRPALGDVDADGTPDLAVAAGFLGGPRVAVFAGRTLLGGDPTKLVNDFFAFPGEDAARLRNGAFVAAGDLDGDGAAELIFGGGPGGAPRVFALPGSRIAAGDIGGAYAAPVANFFVAGNTADRGGVRVGAADADADGRADLLAGSGAGGPARVRVYLGKDIAGPAEPGAFQDLQPFGGAALADGVYVGGGVLPGGILVG
jgi:hypothetical protein